ncbi:hypothetical protein N0V93_006768 [Gnomoniopsis smithogilvyi]|uniref:Uncharacterized protein n=1 Tax=Gnomoniopsis smithogilvyi TaxID=1191159 RepID=A0A9W9CW12_9PEZI|nr:hypothetical protein N0V93_006768 [Gnomoniopsis smithogilvyi]
MFATRDQENLVAMHQSAANTKQQNTRTLQPKTPGARFPKTPLKVPLNDENAARGLGGKSVLANKAKADRAQFVTPGEPRTGRPVLGDKTTNAKTRRINQPTAGKTPAARELEGRSQLGPTTTKGPKSSAPKTDSSKLQILLDNSDPLSDDVDTNPPPPPEQPYESDVFPAGVLTFDAARPENRMKGYYDYYHNRRDENGMTRVDREMKAKQDRRFREADARIRKDMDEMTWDLGIGSPEKKSVLAPQDTNKLVVRPGTAGKAAPSTLNARRAASALGMAPKPSASTTTTTKATTQREPLSAKPAGSDRSLPSFMQPTKARQPTSTTTSTLASRPKIPLSSTAAGIAASRSTLGYTKGRSASSVLQSCRKPEPPAAPVRSFSRSESTASDRIITPASYARDTTEPKPEFVSIFDVPLEEDDADLFGTAGDDALFGGEEEEEEEVQDGFRLQLEL